MDRRRLTGTIAGLATASLVTGRFATTAQGRRAARGVGDECLVDDDCGPRMRCVQLGLGGRRRCECGTRYEECNGRCYPLADKVEECDGRCVATAIDKYNCGRCGKTCDDDRQCCDGRCTDTQRDAGNCGRCGNRCGTAVFPDIPCRGGQCAPTSSTWLRFCDGEWVSTFENNHHCGGCNNRCGIGRMCCRGTCFLSIDPRARCSRGTPDLPVKPAPPEAVITD